MIGTDERGTCSRIGKGKDEQRFRADRGAFADETEGPAMDREEAARAVLAGAGVTEELLRAGTDLIVSGDMGIGNTTPAACLVAAFTRLPAAEVTGRGTSIDDATYQAKVEIVKQSVALQAPDAEDPLGVLAALAGLEHAALVGLILRAAS
jgi:nicotinate-nucleotide--dimethylbenzimidazole phosphoribosyltransferase